MDMNKEKERLVISKKNTNWKMWGPYLSERQWGTVREDYSAHGNAWGSITHDHARSKAYRWGEEGLGGWSDSMQFLCFAWSFWNGKDPILKERLFGLTGPEGNHGEDVKEIYYYLDSSPTHSYAKMLYKYPQSEYPYAHLVDVNRSRTKTDREYEIIDTGIFDKDEYFDIFMEYAKAGPEDICLRARICNRGPEEAEITVLPTFWFRNTWRLGKDTFKPKLFEITKYHIRARHEHLGIYNIYFDQSEQLLFCDNETNRPRVYGSHTNKEYFKDGINNFVVDGKMDAINHNMEGTKASGQYKLTIPAGGEKEVRVRISKEALPKAFGDFDKIFDSRLKETNEFYEELQHQIPDEDLRNIQRQAFAGMMWNKQFYYYNVRHWLLGDPGEATPPQERKRGRNHKWQHLNNRDIISMPDKWEYPWYAAWDLAFHCITLARIDPEFAKEQLLLLLKEWYMHPNGQIPAYEWNFSDVNPPVHAMAVLKVYNIDKKHNGGKGDIDFLEKAFHKLMLNFTWWVNQKDAEGNNVFEGGFLGLDNIGVFDRSHPIPHVGRMEQADASGWMAMFSLNMLRIALDLALEKPNYQEMATKYFEHFLYIAGAINNQTNEQEISLWDEDDNFYYDLVHFKDHTTKRLKLRSIVGLIPLFAIETLKSEAYEKLPEFRERLEFFLKERPKLAAMVSRWQDPGESERRLLALLRGFRMKKILERMTDEEEFLSDYGIRALSKYYEKNPYIFPIEDMELVVKYQPGESDSRMFGGNSNWRGPIWFPINYLLVESLLKFHIYYGEDFKLEYPTGSGKYITLKQLAFRISERLMKIFKKDKNGHRAVYKHEKFQTDPHFKDYILFYEYFNGDTGEGLGASHQTGWTGLIADIILKYYRYKAEDQ